MIAETIIKTVITAVMLLLFIATVAGVNNRGRYEKDNDSDSDVSKL